MPYEQTPHEQPGLGTIVIRWLRRRARDADQPSPLTFHGVGYPKVGNTWLRLTLGHYLQIRYALPELPLLDRGDAPALAAAGVRAIGEFTHHPLLWRGQTAGDLTMENVVRPFLATRVVLLTRYPLDALVSSYMHDRYRVADSPFQGSITDFMTHPVFGLDKLLRFHQLWAGAAGTHPALLVWRYEDALLRPAAELVRVLRFLGEPIDDRAVERAVEQSSFRSLRAMELSGQQPVYKSSQLPIFATGDAANPNALHTRRGQAAGYRQDLPAELCAALERRITAEMPPLFGYQTPPVPQ